MTSTSAEGRGSTKKSPGWKPRRGRETAGFDVLVEDRLDGGKVEPAAGEVGVAQGQLYGEASLGRADVDHALVPLPREPLGERKRGTHGEAGHGVEELLQAVRILVESGEEVLADFGLVLGMARAKGFG